MISSNDLPCDLHREGQCETVVCCWCGRYKKAADFCGFCLVDLDQIAQNHVTIISYEEGDVLPKIFESSSVYQLLDLSRYIQMKRAVRRREGIDESELDGDLSSVEEEIGRRDR